MKKLMTAMCGAVIASAMTGCITDPLKYPQTARDQKVYEATDSRPAPEGQYKIAVLSRMNKACRIEPFIMKIVQEQVDRSVTENFSNLGWFETVDRKNGVALVGESALNGDNGDAAAIPGADFVLIADSFNYYIRLNGSVCATAGQANGVKIETEFRLIDVKTKQPLLSKKIVNSAILSTGSNLTPAISEAANMNAKAFGRLVASRFLPGAEVLQTRGDGRFAQISIGKNYLLQDGSTVEFYTVQKAKKGGKSCLVDNVFATGTVLGQQGQHFEDQKAWVEVNDFETSNVMKGHNAKASEDNAGQN